MKRIELSFEPEPSLDHIEVRVRAAAEDEEVAQLLERIRARETERMTVMDETGAFQIIDVSGIISISVEGKQAKVVTESGRYTVRQALQTLEERLETGRFVRISRYEIVNLDKVLKYDFTLGGTLRLELSNGTETWASRRNIPSIRKKLTKGE